MEGSNAFEDWRGRAVARHDGSGEHALVHGSVGAVIRQRLAATGRGDLHWWFFLSLPVRFEDLELLPDICGYRRERMPSPATGRPCERVPDWVCEGLSPSNPARDRIEKLKTYFDSKVPHDWLIDPVAGTLEVFRRLDLAYALVQTARRGERVRPEPFDAVEFRVDDFLGADPEE